MARKLDLESAMGPVAGAEISSGDSEDCVPCQFGIRLFSVHSGSECLGDSLFAESLPLPHRATPIIEYGDNRDNIMDLAIVNCERKPP